ncbi:uncharacterized protein BDZ83DRAFT_648459 [Colletotrichum acutatum]|uniref:Uncharacterized protein n=1 Tax=Glomerella acutata TaxID=27357 RepID=A0AAD8XK27_GLOAC|nr:uncharacterized protein BDZ83DRAFT_648459 [Colletotrichum acutatum]KAK1728803.1 hypothetical protein BDZ83DRAFT_648459 [Colletotrichum acutatum]
MSTSSQSDSIAPAADSAAQTVNSLLLRTYALLQTPLSILKLHQALNAADQALAIAAHLHRFDLEPRAYLYRGHVLSAWGRWREAHAAYVRAASVRGVGFTGTNIRGLTRDCLTMIEFEDVRRQNMRRALEIEGKGKDGLKMVRFRDEENLVLKAFYDYDDDDDTNDDIHDDDETQSEESHSGLYLILNGSGEVVGSRESLPDLRSVREITRVMSGKGKPTSPTPSGSQNSGNDGTTTSSLITATPAEDTSADAVRKRSQVTAQTSTASDETSPESESKHTTTSSPGQSQNSPSQQGGKSSDEQEVGTGGTKPPSETDTKPRLGSGAISSLLSALDENIASPAQEKPLEVSKDGSRQTRNTSLAAIIPDSDIVSPLDLTPSVPHTQFQPSTQSPTATRPPKKYSESVGEGSQDDESSPSHKVSEKTDATTADPEPELEAVSKRPLYSLSIEVALDSQSVSAVLGKANGLSPQRPRPIETAPRDNVTGHGKNKDEGADNHHILPSAVLQEAEPLTSGSASSESPSPTSVRPLTPRGLVAARERAKRERERNSTQQVMDERLPYPEDSMEFPAPRRCRPESSQTVTSPGKTQARDRDVSPVSPIIHTPTPTRPGDIPGFMRSNEPVSPSTPIQNQRLHGSRSSSTDTVVQPPPPVHNTQRRRPLPAGIGAYNNEPDRSGPGFTLRRIKVPPPGALTRTHIFIRPQPLPGGEEERRMIIQAWNDTFATMPPEFQTMLSSRLRYPRYTRDVAARLRKEEFEKATGESMSSDDYYALFDLETSNDGMISALLEWMQGRTWVKVPFVNRIIHQLCRLMYTSAQEEARLRLTYRQDMDAVMEKLDEVETLTRNGDHWGHIPGVVVMSGCSRDARRWEAFLETARVLALDHQKTEETIENRINDSGEILQQDLEQLSGILRDMAKNSREVNEYVGARHQGDQVQRMFQIDNKDLVDSLRILDDQVNRDNEERRSAVMAFTKIATQRLEVRQRYASSLDYAAQHAREPTMLAPGFQPQPPSERLGNHPLRSAPNEMRLSVPVASIPSEAPAFATTSRQETPPPRDGVRFVLSPRGSQVVEFMDTTVPPEPSPVFTDPFSKTWNNLDLAAARPECLRCPTLEREISARLAEIKDYCRILKYRLDEKLKLESALEAVSFREIRAAMEAIHNYKKLMDRPEVPESLQCIVDLLEMHGKRVSDQVGLLNMSLQLGQTGDSTDKMLAETRTTIRSVKRLADAILELKSQMALYLEKPFPKVGDQSGSGENEAPENEKQTRLIKSLQRQVQELSERTKRTLEQQATEKLELARRVESCMKEERDRLREQVRTFQSKLDMQAEAQERDSNTEQTVSDRLRELNRERETQETELRNLEAQNNALEEQRLKTTEKLAALETAKEESQSELAELARQTQELQIKLQAKSEALKWTSYMTVPRAVDDASSDAQQGNRASQLRTELISALGKARSDSYRIFGDQQTRKALPDIIQSVLWPNTKAKEGINADVPNFWRLAEFVRRRKEIIAALGQRDSHSLQRAFNLLEVLHEWNSDLGAWQTEAQSAEVWRSINLLRSYTNLELGKVEGLEANASERRKVAGALLEQAAASEDAEEIKKPWSSLQNSLEVQLNGSADDAPACDCKFKPRLCPKHQSNGGLMFHNFMESDGSRPAEIELTQEASEVLQRFGETFKVSSPV